MSASGQSRRSGRPSAISGLPDERTFVGSGWLFRFVPIGEVNAFVFIIAEYRLWGLGSEQMKSFESKLRGCSAMVGAAMGAALTLLGLTTPGYACRNPHTNGPAILLEAIPTAAEKSEVIAKVEILEVSYSDIPGYHSFPLARALVIQSIRGTGDGQVIEINAEGDSCGGGLDPRSVGRSGFIAGHFFRLANKTFFIGSW